MNEDEKYLFDLMGYLVIPNALTTEEIGACNQAIDHNEATTYLYDVEPSGGAFTFWPGSITRPIATFDKTLRMWMVAF